MEQKSLSKLYEKLSAKREQFLDRGRECAELTLPAILPKSSAVEEIAVSAYFDLYVTPTCGGI